MKKSTINPGGNMNSEEIFKSALHYEKKSGICMFQQINLLMMKEGKNERKDSFKKSLVM